MHSKASLRQMVRDVFLRRVMWPFSARCGCVGVVRAGPGPEVALPEIRCQGCDPAAIRKSRTCRMRTLVWINPDHHRCYELASPALQLTILTTAAEAGPRPYFYALRSGPKTSAHAAGSAIRCRGSVPGCVRPVGERDRVLYGSVPRAADRGSQMDPAGGRTPRAGAGPTWQSGVALARSAPV